MKTMLSGADAVMEHIKDRGFFGLSGLMAILSFLAAAIVGLVVALSLIFAVILTTHVAFHQSVGSGATRANMNFSGQVVTQTLATDPVCMSAIKAKGGSNFSTCKLVPAVLTADAMAANRKEAQSFQGRLYMVLPTLIYVVQAGLLSWGLFQAGLCFVQLSRGKYFASKTISHLRNFAIAGLVFVIVAPCAPLIYSWLSQLIFSTDMLLHHTLLKPQPGQSWSFSMPGAYTPPNFAIGSRTNFSDVLVAIYAFALAIIAMVMAKAAAIVDDHAQII